MSVRLHQRFDWHLIENGNVGCPRRHADVDIERCLMCAAFDGLEDEDDAVYVVCHPSTGASDALEWGATLVR